jgi:2-keto-4-pentenoate hydratase
MSDSAPNASLAAATLLWRHWQEGAVLEALPLPCRPRTRADGYAWQSQLQAASGRSLVGWKIAATSVAGQRHIAVDGPLAGRLLDGQVTHDGATVGLAGNRMHVAEPEFCFRMGRTLAPRTEPYGIDEVLDAVQDLHPAIEVPDSRYADFTKAGEAQLLADNACAWRFVLGAPASPGWRGIDLARHRVHARVQRADGSTWQREGVGANVLDDPRAALAWLANELSSLDIPLQQGHLVTTGTCMTPLEILAGDDVEIDFGALGRIGVRFSE